MLTMESRMHRKVHVRFGGGVTAASPKQNNVHICSAWAASRTLPYHLGRDPERRVTANGDAVTQFTLATTETWKDKSSGERRQTTEWHRVVLYRKLAEIAGEYLKKGSLVYVEGRLQTRKWTGKDDVERITVEIIADDMRMLGGRPHEHEGDAEHAGTEHHADADQGPAENREPATAARSGASRYDFVDDAIPF